MNRLVITTFFILILLGIIYIVYTQLPEGQPIIRPGFSVYPQKVYVQGEVEFTNITEGEYEVAHWDFGDGDTLQTTTQQEVQHQYNSVGTYPVTLTIGHAVYTDTLNVLEVPAKPLITGPSRGQVGKELTFTCNYPKASTIEWKLDGTNVINGKGETIQHIYNTPGKYTIEAVASVDGRKVSSQGFELRIEPKTQVSAAPSISEEKFKQMLNSREALGRFDRYLCKDRTVPLKTKDGEDWTFNSYYTHLRMMTETKVIKVQLQKNDSNCITSITISDNGG